MKLRRNILFLILLIFLNSWGSAVFSQQRMNIPKKFEMVRKKLNFARSLQPKNNNRKTKDLLNKAEISLRRANRQFRARHFIKANRLITDANNLINRALKKLLEEPFKKRKDKIENLSNRAKVLVLNSDNNKARRFLENGLQKKLLAYQSYKRNNFQESLKYYNQAYQDLLKAINLANNKGNDFGIEAENEAYRFDQFFEFNKKIIESSKNQTVKEFKRLAFKQIREAEKAKRNGNFKQAIELYGRATRLLNRSLDIALGKTDKTELRVYNKVVQLDELIQRIEQRLDKNTIDEEISSQMTHIKQLQVEAHRALDNKNFGIAIEKTRSAQELIERIHSKIKEKS